MTRALALLDRPSAASFGMTPVVVRDGDEIRVLGLSRSSNHRGHGWAEIQIRDLIAAGHALEIEADVPRSDDTDALDPQTVALWVGRDFEAEALSLNLPPAPLPASGTSLSNGRFYFGPAGALYPYLQKWVLRAFRRFRELHGESDRRRIARLMRWVLPDLPETLAASWASAKNQQRELELQARSFAIGNTPAALRTVHQTLLNGVTEDLPERRLVVFTGLTGVHRERLARRFAKEFDLEFRTFRDPIEEHARSRIAHLESHERKQVLMERGQKEVDLSPLALTISVLEAPAKRSGILVVDSLRHSKIRDTLKWLEPGPVFVVAVTADESERRDRLVARDENPDVIVQHQTEREIPRLTESADRRVSETVESAELRQIYDLVNSSSGALT